MTSPASKYNVPVSDMTLHVIEDRRALLSGWGRGNSKLGFGIYSYSKLPGKVAGTCPGASGECELVCYAKRMVKNKLVWGVWQDNTDRGDALPPLPDDATVVRFHVGGDFDTEGYIRSWIELAKSRPAVEFFGYTRSWRVEELLPALEEFRALRNVTLFASMDVSVTEWPPAGWRRAWIEGDERIEQVSNKRFVINERTLFGRIAATRKAIVCPEEAGLVANCESCGYCFKQRMTGDLVFLKH